MVLDSLNEKNTRYERKFLVEDLDINEIEYHVKHNPKMFSEIYHERTVNNIYLDSVDFENYHDNVTGKSQRMKYRIRWYGPTFGQIKRPVLEIKIKGHDLGTKKSYLLKPFILDKNFSRKYLLNEVFLNSKLPKWLIDDLKRMKVALLNRYKRRYFQSFDKKFRITLDYNLDFYRINQTNNTFTHIIQNKDYVIVEMKYDRINDDTADQVANHFPFRLTKSSKYVSGVESLS